MKAGTQARIRKSVAATVATVFVAINLALILHWSGTLEIPDDLYFFGGCLFLAQLSLPAATLVGLRASRSRRLALAGLWCFGLAMLLACLPDEFDLPQFGVWIWALVILIENLLCYYTIGLLVGLWHRVTGQGALQFRIVSMLVATTAVAVIATLFRLDELFGLWIAANVATAAVSLAGVLVSRSWRSAFVATPIVVAVNTGLVMGEIAWMNCYVTGWGGLAALVLTISTGVQAATLLVACGLLRVAGVMRSGAEAFGATRADDPGPATANCTTDQPVRS